MVTKELKDMSLKELWELFPIILKAYRPEYGKWYQEEAHQIVEKIDVTCLYRLSHIGSTAVPGLLSKPTVDILLEIQEDAIVDQVISQLTQLGWGMMSQSKGNRLNHTFQKGYTKHGFDEKVYHLHVRLKGDCKELYFRDYLIDHPEVAQAYETLKKDLQVKYRTNRDAYTDAKTDFIDQYTALALEDFKGRY